MRYRFIKDWHEFKKGHRVPSSVNKAYLKRHGYIDLYTFTQEFLDSEKTEYLPARLTEEPLSKKRGRPKNDVR